MPTLNVADVREPSAAHRLTSRVELGLIHALAMPIVMVAVVAKVAASLFQELVRVMSITGVVFRK